MDPVQLYAHQCGFFQSFLLQKYAIVDGSDALRPQTWGSSGVLPSFLPASLCFPNGPGSLASLQRGVRAAAPGTSRAQPKQAPRPSPTASGRSSEKDRGQPRSRRRGSLVGKEATEPPPVTSAARRCPRIRVSRLLGPNDAGTWYPGRKRSGAQQLTYRLAARSSGEAEVEGPDALGEFCLHGIFLSATPPPPEGLGSGNQDGVAESSWPEDELSGPEAARPLHHQHRRPHGPGRSVYLLSPGQPVGKCRQDTEVARPAATS